MLGVLSEFPHDTVALQPGKMIDEQDAIQMVDLMLEASRQNAVRLDLLRVAITSPHHLDSISETYTGDAFPQTS